MIASIELRRVRHRPRAIVALPHMARLCSASNVFVPSGVLCDIEPNDLHRLLVSKLWSGINHSIDCDRGKYRSRARAVANARFDPSASGFAGGLQRSPPSTSQAAGCRLSTVRRLRATTNGESNMKEMPPVRAIALGPPARSTASGHAFLAS